MLCCVGTAEGRKVQQRAARFWRGPQCELMGAAERGRPEESGLQGELKGLHTVEGRGVGDETPETPSSWAELAWGEGKEAGSMGRACDPTALFFFQTTHQTAPQQYL